jgi:hypothetical protein
MSVIERDLPRQAAGEPYGVQRSAADVLTDTDGAVYDPFGTPESGPFVACSCCETLVRASTLTPHYRGGSNSPLCRACVAGPQISCDRCGQDSPYELMVQIRVATEYGYEVEVYCPCVLAFELAERAVA